MTTPKYYYIYQEDAESIESLSDEEAGIMLKALNKYVFLDEEPDFSHDEDRHLAFVWPILLSRRRRDKKAYQDESVRKAYAGDMNARSEEEEKLSYAGWYEWRTARFRDCEDPILEGYTISDMMLFDSLRIKRKPKKDG